MRPSLAVQSCRQQLRELTNRFGVVRPRLFGSVVTGNDAEDSDLDLLVEPTADTTLLTIAALQNEAERLLGVRVDVQTLGSIPARFRERVLNQAVPL